jgi:AP2 domain./HNH endonuclease.
MRNRYEVGDGIVVIYLTRKDGTVLETEIELEDLPKLGNVTSLYADKKRNTYYVRCNLRSVDGKQDKIYLHQLLMDAPKGTEVDHIDGNGLNNKRSNLRIVTNSENQYNRRHKSRYPKSGVPGVYWFPQTSKWKAQVILNGKNVHLGYFDNVREAAEVVRRFKEKHGLPLVN